jgi:hypothetical protein
MIHPFILVEEAFRVWNRISDRAVGLKKGKQRGLGGNRGRERLFEARVRKTEEWLAEGAGRTELSQR